MKHETTQKQSTRIRVKIGASHDKGLAVWNWYVQTVDDGNDEPIAGGYCASEVDALSDARIWVALNPAYFIG